MCDIQGLVKQPMTQIASATVAANTQTANSAGRMAPSTLQDRSESTGGGRGRGWRSSTVLRWLSL